MNRPQQQQQRSRNIILVGMPCAGKTTFGRVLAVKTGRQFVDFDSVVERQAGKSIKAIFTEEGEAGFRQREQKCLQLLERKRGAIIALGGGTFCNPSAVALARNLGIVLFLSTPLDEIAVRAFREKEGRPLFAACASEVEARAVVDRLWELRQPYYDCADVHVDMHFSSLDCLTLQIYSIERHATGILQRRTQPEILTMQRVTPVVNTGALSASLVAGPRGPAETWEDVVWQVESAAPVAKKEVDKNDLRKRRKPNRNDGVARGNEPRPARKPSTGADARPEKRPQRTQPGRPAPRFVAKKTSPA